MYFDKPGKENTEKTVELALQTAKERGINYILIASSSGASAELLVGKGPQIICITHVNGFREPGKMTITKEMKDKLEAGGAKILTASHVLSGAERGISRTFGGAYPVEIMAHTLRMLSQGVKVCVEISVMALDAGLIPFGEKVIAIGGTGQGVDTASIVTPSHAQSIFDTKINEIICKPR